MASRAENMRDIWVAELALITTANGYRNELSASQVSKALVDPETLNKFPHVCVELGPSVIKTINGDWTTFCEEVEIYIIGFARADTETATSPDAIAKMQDAMESLVHDLIRKICSDLIKRNLVAAVYRWNVLANASDDNIKFTINRVNYLGIGRNLGEVSISGLKVEISAEDANFSEYITSESGVTITSEAGVGIEE